MSPVSDARLWARVRRPARTLALLAGAGALTGVVVAWAPSERAQFLPIAGASVLAWALRNRDTPRERQAPRPPLAHDAALVTAGACATLILTVLTVLLAKSQMLSSGAFTLWGVLFTYGLLAALMSVGSVVSALVGVVAVQVVLYLVRFLTGQAGPTLSLITQESPPLLAWPLSLAVLITGVCLLRWPPVRHG